MSNQNKKKLFSNWSIFTFFLGVAFCYAIFSSFSEGSTIKNTLSGLLPQVIEPIRIEAPIDFAGEKIPLENFDVRERLDRELNVNAYWHSNTLTNIKSAAKYFPIIEPILAEHGVPDDFKYLAVAESSLRNVVSPAGAKGIWQIMKAVGNSFGLEINSEVDERYHLEKSTEVACKLLIENKNRFGSWLMAAAAYNVGSPRLAREAENQRSNNYFDLNLNSETARYVFRLVAIKQILSKPEDYGFYLEENDLYGPLSDYIEVKINEPIENLGDFASKHGISYRMLKVYNPWLLDHKLTNRDRKEYTLKIPRSTF